MQCLDLRLELGKLLSQLLLHLHCFNTGQGLEAEVGGGLVKLVQLAAPQCKQVLRWEVSLVQVLETPGGFQLQRKLAQHRCGCLADRGPGLQGSLGKSNLVVKLGLRVPFSP